MSAQRDHRPRVVAFRVDASLEIGTGHVMRCLTLARALSEQGVTCHFLCRDHPGHLMNAIETNGFSIHALSNAGLSDSVTRDIEAPVHAHWLGTGWQQDAEQSRSIIQDIGPDWLVVDHYALDARWEEAVLPDATRLLVIDDLADRAHLCDLLLDQNLGKTLPDYAGLLPSKCITLLGPYNALLRPEFAKLRDRSLERRADSSLHYLLINMGGVDLPNATGRVLRALTSCSLPADCRIDVVLGGRSPWVEDVREAASRLPWAVDVAVGVSDMAERMLMADMAIGAAGGTSWERCCLGLPSLLIVIADNQWSGARMLHDHGAGILVGGLDDIEKSLSHCMETAIQDIHHLSFCASRVTDGLGANRVSSQLSGNDDERNRLH